MSATVLSFTGLAIGLARGLREAFFMFWETLWPLILGFGLSGMVQAFVSREAMQRRLGNHGVVATARASGYGMISSSCSYAASAMSKSLFVKGADFVATLVFMFASTNLVVELGVILIVLMGLQFAASEFIGGAIMIVLLAAFAGAWFKGSQIEQARRRLAGSVAPAHGHEADPAHDHATPTNRMNQPEGWANAATYTMSDLTMLRKELIVGYGIAGILATAVPVRWWNVLFLHGHGFWTSLENALIGPFIAIISFVCSVGNVPLAAALWHGGISFGGVVSFIFADLIAFPLLMIYRRYYGTRIMLKMLATFWLVMALAGLLTEELFQWWKLVPSVRPTQIAPAHFSWNYTTYLNFVFLALFAAWYWIYRNRERLGAGVGYAIDPICSMQVQIATAPAMRLRNGERHYFCSDRCADRFDTGAADSAPLTMAMAEDAGLSADMVVDPVCQMVIDPASSIYELAVNGGTIYFCSSMCRDEYGRRSVSLATTPGSLAASHITDHPSRGGHPVEPQGREERVRSQAMFKKRSSKSVNPGAHNHGSAGGADGTDSIDPICGMRVKPASAAATRTADGTEVYFCSVGCAEAFDRRQ